MHKTVLIVGISGATCAGKTTTTSKLGKLLPNAKIFTQDDYFLDVDDERHVWIPELNHINYDILSSLDMEKMHSDISDYISDKQLVNTNAIDCSYILNTDYPNYEERLIELQEKIHRSKIEVILIEGFSIFNYKPLLDLFHLKYYFTLNKEECYKRRIQRVYDPPDCPGYFDLCAWPEHLKQLEEVRNTVENVRYFKGTVIKPEEQIISDILTVSSGF